MSNEVMRSLPRTDSGLGARGCHQLLSRALHVRVRAAQLRSQLGNARLPLCHILLCGLPLHTCMHRWDGRACGSCACLACRGDQG